METNKRDDGKMTLILLLYKTEAVIEENGSMIKKREKVFMTFLYFYFVKFIITVNPLILQPNENMYSSPTSNFKIV
jgi:hypothetical protein